MRKPSKKKKRKPKGAPESAATTKLVVESWVFWTLTGVPVPACPAHNFHFGPRSRVSARYFHSSPVQSMMGGAYNISSISHSEPAHCFLSNARQVGSHDVETNDYHTNQG